MTIDALLDQPKSHDVDLSLQGIDTSHAKTFGEVVRAILDHAEKKDSEQVINNARIPQENLKYADRTLTSIVLPLRSAIFQQTVVSPEQKYDLRRKIVLSHKSERKGDKERGRYEKMSQSKRKLLLMRRLESEIEKLRRKEARKMTTILFGENTELVGFFQERERKKELSDMLTQRESIKPEETGVSLLVTP